ncbi:MAG: PRC-barrel domain-containing protein [Candidatus Hadarchaeum sp.]|uniref:PRC-barrel domain-containing protein n=1 Tax=Candidatus Hadarchaeum sp. TaxID=2883567 RepID=UPI003D0C6DFA
MKRLSELNGLKVYSDRARYVGTVEDAVLDDKEGAIVGLVFERKGGKALSIPYSSVMAIGEIILIQSRKEEAVAPT